VTILRLNTRAGSIICVFARLSAVYSMLGDANNYRKARYRAWELGIGQGGFGGNR
jgi:hypothetical protein